MDQFLKPAPLVQQVKVEPEQQPPPPTAQGGQQHELAAAVVPLANDIGRFVGVPPGAVLGKIFGGPGPLNFLAFPPSLPFPLPAP